MQLECVQKSETLYFLRKYFYFIVPHSFEWEIWFLAGSLTEEESGVFVEYY